MNEPENSSLMNPSLNSFKADDISPPSSKLDVNEDLENIKNDQMDHIGCDHLEENEEYNSLNKRETSFYVKDSTMNEVALSQMIKSRTVTPTSKEPLSMTLSQENKVHSSRTTSPIVKEFSRTVTPKETSMKSGTSAASTAPPKPPRLQEYADMLPLAKVI